MKQLLSIIAILITSVLYAQDIDIAGAIHLGNTTTPTEGAIRWTGADFEGYNGSGWISLTGGAPPQYGIVTDIDGHDYRTVEIGSQTWMADNLKVIKYNNGDALGSALNEAAWIVSGNLDIAAYTRIQDNDEWTSVFGLFYNWHVIDPATNGGKNVCPTGWHVPTQGEWHALRAVLGGFLSASTVKTRGSIPTQTGPWLHDFNGNMTNTSGFDAMPTGMRDPTGPFMNLRQNVFFWTSTLNVADNARVVKLSVGNNFFETVTSLDRDAGAAIRCIKDD